MSSQLRSVAEKEGVRRRKPGPAPGSVRATYEDRTCKACGGTFRIRNTAIRSFCTRWDCRGRFELTYWEEAEARFQSARKLSNRCSARYYRMVRGELAAWSRTLEEVALERQAEDRRLIDELRSKGDEISALIEEQERDARRWRLGHAGQVSLDRSTWDEDGGDEPRGVDEHGELIGLERFGGYVVYDPTGEAAVASVLRDQGWCELCEDFHLWQD